MAATPYAPEPSVLTSGNDFTGSDFVGVFQMQMFIRGFAIFAVLCSAPAAFGSLVIDNFNTFFVAQGASTTSAAQVLTNNPAPSNTFQRKVATGASVTALAGTSTVNFGNGANRTSAVTYDLQAINNFSPSDVLEFTYTGNSNTANNYRIEIIRLATFDGTLNAIGTSVFNQPGLPNGPNTVSVPVGVTTLASFRYLQVRVSKSTADNNSANQNFTFQNLTMTAVPEPATMTLLGLTGIAGVIAHRRRRKAQLAA